MSRWMLRLVVTFVIAIALSLPAAAQFQRGEDDHRLGLPYPIDLKEVSHGQTAQFLQVLLAGGEHVPGQIHGGAVAGVDAPDAVQA